MTDEWDSLERDHEGNYVTHGMFGEQKYTPEHVAECRRRVRERDERATAATLTRRPFDLTRPCPKCGHGRRRPWLVRLLRPCADVRYTRCAETEGAAWLGKGEAIIRECDRCGGTWAEQPLDAEA